MASGQRPWWAGRRAIFLALVLTVVGANAIQFRKFEGNSHAARLYAVARVSSPDLEALLLGTPKTRARFGAYVSIGDLIPGSTFTSFTRGVEEPGQHAGRLYAYGDAARVDELPSAQAPAVDLTELDSSLVAEYELRPGIDGYSWAIYSTCTSCTGEYYWIVLAPPAGDGVDATPRVVVIERSLVDGGAA